MQYSGPSVCLAFVLSGFVALCTALVYAELSSRYPVNGSAFAFIYAIHGELPAWLVGWCLNLRYGVSAGGLSRGIAAYLQAILLSFGLALPSWLFSC